METLGSHLHMSVTILLDHLNGNLPADCCDLSFEASYTGFFGIVPNDPKQCIVGKCHVFGSEPIGFFLLLQKIPLSNAELLEFGIAGDSNNFHSVLQWPRNTIKSVCCRDKHHF